MSLKHSWKEKSVPLHFADKNVWIQSILHLFKHQLTLADVSTSLPLRTDVSTSLRRKASNAGSIIEVLEWDKGGHRADPTLLCHSQTLNFRGWSAKICEEKKLDVKVWIRAEEKSELSEEPSLLSHVSAKWEPMWAGIQESEKLGKCGIMVNFRWNFKTLKGKFWKLKQNHETKI